MQKWVSHELYLGLAIARFEIFLFVYIIFYRVITIDEKCFLYDDKLPKS